MTTEQVTVLEPRVRDVLNRTSTESIRVLMALTETTQADLGALLELGQSSISDRMRGKRPARASQGRPTACGTGTAPT